MSTDYIVLRYSCLIATHRAGLWYGSCIFVRYMI